MKIDDKKNNQRNILAKKRAKLILEKKNASLEIIDNLKKLDNFYSSKVVASFLSIKSEISTIHLNKFIIESGKILCLPAMNIKSKKLTFRKYNFQTKLIKGKYDILEPVDTNSEFIPDIIFTPCLAFDIYGFRLGYGGGYYDKTFLDMKNNNKKFISVALAFDDQKVDQVFYDEYDQRIDYILTEKELYKRK